MKQLSEKQLNMRIETFITRKHQQFPELKLRSNKEYSESIGYAITDKISGLVASFKMTNLA